MNLIVNNNLLMKFFIMTQQGSADEARIGPKLCGKQRPVIEQRLQSDLAPDQRQEPGRKTYPAANDDAVDVEKRHAIDDRTPQELRCFIDDLLSDGLACGGRVE